jgi:hypothetical protein
VHYLLDFEKTIQIDTVYDDRYGISEIGLNWTVGGGDTMTVPMVPLDTNVVEWRENLICEALLADQAFQIGDTICYWVTAKDGSNNTNASQSVEQHFIAEDHEILGAWDRLSRYEDILSWEPFQHGLLMPMAPWANVINLVMSNTDTVTDTMTMIRHLDLTRFEDGWINIPMAHNFIHQTGYGLVQFFSNDVWHTVDSLFGFQVPDTFSYSLDDFLSADDFSIRFLADRGEGGITWLIDDILLHQDPDLVGIHDRGKKPLSFRLQQNYPNPFNPTTSIKYNLPIASDVNMTVYDITGRTVTTLEDAYQGAGSYLVQWSGIDDSGNSVSTGVYFCRLCAGDFSKTIKMLYMK